MKVTGSNPTQYVIPCCQQFFQYQTKQKKRNFLEMDHITQTEKLIADLIDGKDEAALTDRIRQNDEQSLHDLLVTFLFSNLQIEYFPLQQQQHGAYKITENVIYYNHFSFILIFLNIFSLTESRCTAIAIVRKFLLRTLRSLQKEQWDRNER